MFPVLCRPDNHGWQFMNIWKRKTLYMLAIALWLASMPIRLFDGIFPFRVMDLYDVFLAVFNDPDRAIIALPVIMLFSIPALLHVLLTIWIAGMLVRLIDRLRDNSERDASGVSETDVSKKGLVPSFFSFPSFVCIALPLVIALFLMYPFHSVNQPPKVHDAKQLVSDCQELIDLHSQGKLTIVTEGGRQLNSIVSEQWPASIASLRPICVYVDNERVTILTSTGGIDPSFGYMIPKLEGNTLSQIGTERPVVQGVKIRETPYSNVWFWRGIE